jgi:hypothetical protein
MTISVERNFITSICYALHKSTVEVLILVSASHAPIEEQSLPVLLSTIIAAAFTILLGETASPGEYKGFDAICSANVRGDDAIFSQIRGQLGIDKSME